MTSGDGVRREPGSGAGPPREVLDDRLRALAHGLEFSKRCHGAGSLDELYLLLTNDIRSFIPFDRSLLLVHLGTRTELVAVGNHPEVPANTRFHEEAKAMGGRIRDVARGILLSGETDAAGLQQYGLEPGVAESLLAYVTFAGCSHLLVMPLSHGDRPMAHLVLEFFPGSQPDETRLLALLSLASLLAPALAAKWIAVHAPGTKDLLRPGGAAGPPRRRAVRHIVRLALGAALAASILFGIPIPVRVGGEAQVRVTVRHMAFSLMDGLVETVAVTEGDRVTRDQVLATLDRRELDYQVRSTRRKIEILEGEMTFLQRSAAQGQAEKLAERRLVELKRKGAEADLEFFEWQLRFLEIRSPVDGTVVTRDVESLAGKRLRPGEPFCEVQSPQDLAVEVHVPEDRVSLVRAGARLSFHLDAEPRVAHPLVVQEIAPRADVLPRLGNVFRVRAPFPDAPEHILPGMKGIGSIRVGTTDLWSLVGDRIRRLWRRWSLVLS